MAKKKKITLQQKLFALEYIKDFNATQAAIRAGYSKKTAYSQGQRLLKNVVIKKLVEKAKREREDAVKIDVNWVLDQAVKVHNRCMALEPITKVVDGVSVKTGSFIFNAAQANKSLEIVGKHVSICAFDNSIPLVGDPDRPLHVHLDATERAARIAQLLGKAIKGKKK